MLTAVTPVSISPKSLLYFSPLTIGAEARSYCLLQKGEHVTEVKPVNRADYARLAQELRIAFDHNHGVLTQYDPAINTFTRHVASEGLPESTRGDEADRYVSMLPSAAYGHPWTESLNVLSRCLAITRTLDHVLSSAAFRERRDFKDSDTTVNMSPTEYLNLKFNQFCAHLYHLQHSDFAATGAESTRVLTGLKMLEEAFNRELIYIAEAAGFEALGSKAEKFLLYLRNMSSVLDPAPTLETKIYNAAGQLILSEKAIPITAKTERQIAAFINFDSGFYRAHSLQELMVDHALVGLVVMGDRQLGAQCRKTHLPGLKNAYLTVTTVERGKGAARSVLLSHEIRSATPVYVGKGASAEEQTTAAAENLRQLRYALRTQDSLVGYRALAYDTLHLSILNTNSATEHQDEMVKYSRAAIVLTGGSTSYTPTNWEGRFSALEIATALRSFTPEAESFLARLKRLFIDTPEHGMIMVDHASRVFRAAAISFIAAQSGHLAMTACASGQDRTGTLSAIKAVLTLMQADNVAFSSETEFKAHFAGYAEKYAAGRHQAILAHLLVPGAPGMKSDSCVAGVFPAAAAAQLYWPAAKMNKSAPVGEVRLTDLAPSIYVPRVPKSDATAGYRTAFAVGVGAGAAVTPFPSATVAVSPS